MCAHAVADPEEAQGVRSNPTLRQNYSIFMENFQKNQENITNELRHVISNNVAF